MIAISRGTHRAVLAIPRFGIAIKFPRLIVERKGKTNLKDHFVQFFYWDLRLFLRRPKSGWNYFHDEVLPDLIVGSTFNIRIVGIEDNRQERQYWQCCSSVSRCLLVPTYVSCYGLLNIQAYREPSKDPGIYYAIKRALPKGTTSQSGFDWHHLVNATNFHLNDGRLLFLDYGDTITQAFIDKYALELLMKFDIGFGRRRAALVERKLNILRERAAQRRLRRYQLEDTDINSPEPD